MQVPEIQVLPEMEDPAEMVDLGDNRGPQAHLADRLEVRELIPAEQVVFYGEIGEALPGVLLYLEVVVGVEELRVVLGAIPGLDGGRHQVAERLLKLKLLDMAAAAEAEADLVMPVTLVLLEPQIQETPEILQILDQFLEFQLLHQHLIRLP
jgi:hypothetical protein